MYKYEYKSKCHNRRKRGRLIVSKVLVKGKKAIIPVGIIAVIAIIIVYVLLRGSVKEEELVKTNVNQPKEIVKTSVGKVETATETTKAIGVDKATTFFFLKKYLDNQVEMAKLLDVTSEYLSMVETGKRNLSKKLLRKFESLHGAPPPAENHAVV